MVQLPKKLPRFEKVCCCMPLRGGVIFLVYFNLLLSIGVSFFFGTLDVIQFFYRVFTMKRSDMYLNMRKSKMAALPEFIFICLILCLLAEICMSVVALVGLHKNRTKLLKIYLYYAVCMSFFMCCFRMFDVGVVWMVEVPAVFIYICIKCHYILALRSQLKKLEGNVGVHEDDTEEYKIEMNITNRKNVTNVLCDFQSDINYDIQPDNYKEL